MKYKSFFTRVAGNAHNRLGEECFCSQVRAVWVSLWGSTYMPSTAQIGIEYKSVMQALFEPGTIYGLILGWQHY